MAGVLRKFTNTLGPARGGLARHNYAVDWAHPMSKNLSFCVLLNSRAVRDIAGMSRNDSQAGAVVTPLSYQQIAVDAPSGAVEELSPYGPGLQFTNLDSSKLDYGIQQAVTASPGSPNGDGGPNGLDFTVLTIANPASHAVQQPTLFSQRKQAGAQIDIICNSDHGNAQSPGDVTFFAINTVGTNFSSQTQTGNSVDGNYHVFVGRMQDFGAFGATNSVWVDGVNVSPLGNQAGAVGLFWDQTQKLAVSGLADAAVDSYTANCTVVLTMVWNRSLSDDEILSISLDPYQFIIPEETDVPMLAALQAAIAGSTIMLGQGWM